MLSDSTNRTLHVSGYVCTDLALTMELTEMKPATVVIHNPASTPEGYGIGPDPMVSKSAHNLLNLSDDGLFDEDAEEVRARLIGHVRSRDQ